MSTRDKLRARKFANCKCKEVDNFTYHKDFKQCNVCDFKWDTSKLYKASNKLSKRDQLCNKDD